jgi:hypothetical protein
MNRSNGIGQYAPRTGALAGLCLFGALLAGCAGDTPAPNTGTDGSGGSGGGGAMTGGGGGSRPATGGAGGSTASGGSGGSVASGGSGGGASGGASGSGSGGASSGGGGGSSAGGSGGATADAGADVVMGTGGSAGKDGGPANPDSPCYGKINNYTLPGLPVQDFCDAYEKYCLYTPDGSMMSKCGPGQKTGPLFRDRADCEMQYMKASAAGKACRAGQLCNNGPIPGRMVNACSHATGYCAAACGT